MGYGLGTWNKIGAVELNESSFTVRLVLSVLVTFDSVKGTQNFSVLGCNSSNSIAFVVPIESVASSQRQFETEMLEGVVRVYNYTRTFEASSVARGTMRLFVVRFR